jgi:hypothetical protein
MTRSKTLTTAAIAAVAAAFVSVVAVQPAAAARTAKVSIGLASKKTTKSYLASRIRAQVRRQGVKASNAQVQRAAQTALNKIKAKGPGPQPGIILIHFKKLKATVCISWGEHKDYCNKHAKSNFAKVRLVKKSFVN